MEERQRKRQRRENGLSPRWRLSRRHPSSRGSGIFNYSLGEIVERGEGGEENNAAGAPSRAASVPRALLCVYLVLLIASAWSRLYHYRRSRISVCSLHLCNPPRQCVLRFIGETALPRNPSL